LYIGAGVIDVENMILCVIVIVIEIVFVIVIVIMVGFLWLFDPRTSLLCRQRDFIGAYGIFNKRVKYVLPELLQSSKSHFGFTIFHKNVSGCAAVV
jgi:hypothetical protein